MPTVQIYVNKLTADYSSTCNFKIKIVLNSSPYRESAENKHSFKYEKGASVVNIYEQLNLKCTAPLNSESKLQFFLEVYTKSGYKTAGIGVLNLSKGVKENTPIEIEIKKCPLGKGKIEIQFLNINLKPSTTPNKINIHKSNKKNNSNLNNSNNDISYQDKSYISNISYATNITHIEPISNNYHSNNSPKNNNNIKSSNYIGSSNNMNEEIIKQKDRQINELKTKIDYYESENNELKNLLNDFKKEKKALNEEKNKLLNIEREKLQKALNEKEELQIQYNSLQQNINILKNNKNTTEQKIMNIKAQTDKQIKELTEKVRNLSNIKMRLENEDKVKEEKIIILDRKIKEMTINYQKKLAEINNNFSYEKNNNMRNYNEKLKLKEEEVVKLNIKIKSMEENIQSLNEIIEINDKQKGEKEEMTENMKKLLDQISKKDKQITELRNEVSDLNNKILTEINDRKTQNMLNGRTEKDLKNNINELQNIINQKDNELLELRTKYDNLKYNSNKLKPKIHFIEDSDDEYENNKDNGNNEMLLNQIKDIQKTYKEREEKLLKEKNEEIQKLRMRNKDLERESYIDSKNNYDIKKYINEIKRLKTINTNLEEDLGYYKELNNKYVNNEKRTTVFETENIKLQNLLQQKNEEIDSMKIKHKKLEEEKSTLETQLVNSKGKLGEVLNELAEAETKCVHLEEEKKQMKRSIKFVF